MGKYDKFSLDGLTRRKARLEKQLAAINEAIAEHEADPTLGVKMADWHTYALLCEDGHYYIGTTSNVDRRFKQHLRGKGSWFTKIHKPIRVVESTHIGYMSDGDAVRHENRLTAIYMRDYGIHKVRGGGFIQHDSKYFMRGLNLELGKMALEANREMDAALENALARSD